MLKDLLTQEYEEFKNMNKKLLPFESFREKYEVWLRSHDKRVLAKVVEMVESKRKESLSNESPFPYYQVGYEKALDDLLTSLQRE